MASLLTAGVLMADPTLAPIADLEVPEDAGLLEVPLRLDPSPLAADQFLFSFTTDNETLLPPGTLNLTGASPNPTLQIRTPTNASGTATITVAALTRDMPPLILLQKFRLQVAAVDDPPQIEPIPNQVLTLGGPTLRIPIVVSDPDSVVAVLSPASDDQQLLKINVENSTAGRFITLLAFTTDFGLPKRTQVRITVTADGKRAQANFYVSIRQREFRPSDEQPFGQRWSSIAPQPSGVSSLAMTWADVNRDGFPDVSISGRALVMTNPKFGSAGSSFSIGRNPFLGFDTILWADTAGDGNPEVFAEGPAGIGVGSRSSASGTGAVALSQGKLVALNVAGAAWADVNGDGRPDLIYSGGTNEIRRVVIATRDGDGSYRPAAIELPEVAGPVVAEDFDQDGRTDLLLCDASLPAHAARIYWNRMPEGFVEGPTVASDFPVTSAGSADANGDGVPDLWLVQQTTQSPPRLELNVYLQQYSKFDRSFHLDSDEFVGAGAPAWGDFNHDGFPDFIAPRQVSFLQANGKLGSSNYFVLYRNRGDGSFTPGDFLFDGPFQSPNRIPTFIPAAADVDLDGDLDIIGYQKTLRPFYNQQLEPNVPPETPTGLHAFVLGQDLHLFWSPSTDRNQTTPLTYNVRAGSKPGLGDLIPSQSLTNGLRQVPAPGNAGFLLSRTIHLPILDVEAIYWSVQAVDASFSGGPFAPEQVLEMNFPGNQPPSLQTPGEITLTEDATFTARFTVSDDRTAPDELKLFAVSDNPDLFPASGLQIVPPRNSTSPIAHDLFLRPATNGFGTATVFVMATDRNGKSTTNAISVTVRPQNDIPELRVFVPEFANRNTQLSGVIHVSDVETPPDDLKLRVISSNPELLSSTGISVQGSGDTRTLLLTPSPDRIGDVTVTVTVEDDDGGSEVTAIRLQWRDQLLVPQPLPEAMTHLIEAHWVDFDGDGVLDVVGSDRGKSGILALWRRNPSGVFEEASEVDIGFTADAILIGDFDGDGDADVVASTSPSTPAVPGATVAVAWNDGGRLTRRVILRSDAAPQFLVALDVDSDGDLDLVSADGISELRVLRHTPQGFETAWSDLPLYNPAAIKGGVGDPGIITGLGTLDFNADGRTDLFLSRNRSTPRGRGVLLLQQPTGLYLVQLPLWNSSAQFTDSADFDNDGQPDFLIQDWGSGENPSKIVFSDLNHPVLEARISYGNVGDLDGNGTEDALGTFGILVGLADGTSEILRQNTEFWGVEEPDSGDFDQDGRLDLLAQKIGVLSLFKNLGTPTNRPPQPPAQLHFEQLPLEIAQLSWSSAIDPDQSRGLTYNLRVGTAPGANDIVPSLALPDGRGLVPTRGNSGWSLSRELRNLAPGRTYYWSVQAIDSGRSRSAFAPEQSFQVTGTPKIAEIDDVSVPLNTTRVEVPISIQDPETPTAQLHIEVVSQNPVMLPPSRIHLGGTPDQPILILEPKRDRAGTATIVVRATDGDGHATERSFTFYIPSNSGHTLETLSAVDVPAGGEVALSLDDFDRDGEFQDYQMTFGPTHGTVEIRGPKVLYRPDAKFLGEDRIEFLATTPGSWPAFGRVTLRVVPAHHLRPELRLIHTGFPKRLQIVLRSLTDARLTLESSSDLIHWTPLGDQIIPSSEILVLDPPEFTLDSPHFLRANLAQ